MKIKDNIVSCPECIQLREQMRVLREALSQVYGQALLIREHGCRPERIHWILNRIEETDLRATSEEPKPCGLHHAALGQIEILKEMGASADTIARVQKIANDAAVDPELKP